MDNIARRVFLCDVDIETWTKDIRYWLLDNIDRENWYIHSRPMHENVWKPGSRKMHGKIVYAFYQSNDALMFRLAWKCV